MKTTYLLVDLLTVSIPFAFSFHPKIKFNKNFSSFIRANMIVSLAFLTWDAIFTSIGVWGFNDNYILGIRFFHLPVEEILFFVCIPFACVFTYHCSLIFFRMKWNQRVENTFVFLLALLLLILGLVFWQKAYTSVTFVSTAILVLTLKFYFNANWLVQFFSIYPLLLIPFFIVNGILTGTGLDQPVVYYNDAENLGIRLLTIPIEDVVYGFELLLMNIFLYERFNSHEQGARGKEHRAGGIG